MKKINLILCFLFLFFGVETLQASTAFPSPIVFTQPDGSQITIILKGDEKMKWAETMDGYSLLFNNNGYYEYAMLNYNKDMVPSGVIAKEISQRSTSDNSFLSSISKKLFYSIAQVALAKQAWHIYDSEKSINAFPTTGNRKLICILIGFSDLAFTKTQQDFDNLFNQLNYTTDGASGSVKDFYLENSYNLFNLTVTVAGPYTASNTMAYYGANTGGAGSDIRPRNLVTEAVNLANPDVNYADFDNDSDGSVDGVYVIYAGYGEEAGASTNAIWAHASSISSLTLDGKTVSRYSCSPEQRGNSGSGLTRIGVICHEFGHVLGARDYYDTDYATNGQYPGTGKWDVMANGTWNNSGATPAHHNAYTKCYVYGWATVNLLTSSQTVEAYNSVEYSDYFYRYNTTTSNEYFLLENRQLVGFDVSLPGHGLIIYHVDGDSIASKPSRINADAHQGMFPMSAVANTENGVMENGSVSVSGCSWPGTGEKTQFTENTIPNSKSWVGAITPWSLTNITEDVPNKTISFSISDSNPVNFTGSAADSSQIDLSWNLNSGYSVMLVYNTSPVFGTPVNGTAYAVGNTISGGGTVLYYGTNTDFSHTNLAQKTEYYYKLYSDVSSNNYSSGISHIVATSALLPFTESFTGTSLPACWTQKDNQGNGKIWQFGVISYTYFPVPVLNGNYAYLNSDAYGGNITENADLISPTLDLTYFTDVNLQFNHSFFLDGADESGTLSYSIDNGDSWTIIETYTATTTNPVAFNLDIPEVESYSQVKFKWNYTGIYGYYWAIDDVSITGTNLNDREWSGISSTDWNNADNWTGGVPNILSDIIVPSGTPNMLIINTDPSTPAICNNLTINNGGNITVNAGKAFTVNGIFTNNGLISVKADGTGIGSFINNDTMVGNGTAVVEKFLLSTNPYGWALCSPVDTSTATVFNGALVYYYNALEAEWTVYNSGMMQSMLGYVTKYSIDTTLSFSNSLNSGYMTFNKFYRTDYNAGNFGWNLIGNPYPSAIGWDEVVEMNGGLNFLTSTKLNASIYLSDSVGGYLSYVDGEGSELKVGTGLYNGLIPPSTAFWMQVNENFISHSDSIENCQLILNNSVRLHKAGTSKKSPLSKTLRLKLEKNNLKDETVICLKNPATLHFDPNYDALKMMSENVLYPQIYSLSSDEEKLSINSISDVNLTETQSIPIGFFSNTGGDLTLTAYDFANIDVGLSIHIEDVVENKIIDLRQQNTYVFQTSSGTHNERFIVHLGLNSAGISSKADNFNPVQIYTYNNSLFISSPGETAEVFVYNLLGQQMLNQKIAAGSVNKIDTDLSSGFYFVEVVGSTNTATKKIFIN